MQPSPTPWKVSDVFWVPPAPSTATPLDHVARRRPRSRCRLRQRRRSRLTSRAASRRDQGARSRTRRPALICWNNTLTLGGPGTLFSCLGDAEPIFMNQRIRLRVEFISGQPIDLFYDGSGVQEDSSITVPVSVPEFGDIVAPVAATGMLVLFLSRRRRRRTR